MTSYGKCWVLLAFSHSSGHIYALQLLIICQELGNRLHSDAAHAKIFCEDLLAKSITDPKRCLWLMDCLVVVFMDEFSNFFNIFCHYAGA
jgi:hypothetical protein